MAAGGTGAGTVSGPGEGPGNTGACFCIAYRGRHTSGAHRWIYRNARRSGPAGTAASRGGGRPVLYGKCKADMLEVLGGFTEQVLADRRCYLALVQQAPAWARQRLREMAAEQACHARRLMAVHYLITGECYRPVVRCEHLYVGRWCPGAAANTMRRPATASTMPGRLMAPQISVLRRS